MLNSSSNMVRNHWVSCRKSFVDCEWRGFKDITVLPNASFFYLLYSYAKNRPPPRFFKDLFGYAYSKPSMETCSVVSYGTEVSMPLIITRIKFSVSLRTANTGRWGSRCLVVMQGGFGVKFVGLMPSPYFSLNQEMVESSWGWWVFS